MSFSGSFLYATGSPINMDRLNLLNNYRASLQATATADSKNIAFTKQLYVVLISFFEINSCRHFQNKICIFLKCFLKSLKVDFKAASHWGETSWQTAFNRESGSNQGKIGLYTWTLWQYFPSPSIFCCLSMFRVLNSTRGND